MAKNQQCRRYLDRMAYLERMYDGPIPADELRAAQALRPANQTEEGHVMNWIDLPDNLVMVSGCEVSIDVRAAGHYSKGSRVDDTDPGSPAAFEVHSVEMRFPEGAWQSFPVNILRPEHMDAIARWCLQETEDRADSDAMDAAEYRGRLFKEAA